MIIDIEQDFNKLNVSYINFEGNLRLKEIPIPKEEKFEWVYTKPNQKKDDEFMSWDGKPVTKKKTKFLNKYRIEEFLINQPEQVKKDLYARNEPKMFFCDIEVEITSDGFPHAHLAKNKVTAIAFCTGKKMMVLGTRKLTASEIKKTENQINEHFKDHYDISFQYIYFKNEYDMLYSFMKKAIHKMPLITGWNFVGFDWQYLVNRCKRLGIDPAISSPTNKLHRKEELPLHRMVVDYLDIYKKWDRMVSVKENNSLDFVGKAVLGIQKIKYEGSLQDLYEQDFQKYIFYNAVDTFLVQLIHEKLLTMNTYTSLINTVGVEAIKAFSPINMTETVMVREFYKRKRVIVRNKKSKGEKEKYEGAFVFKPVPGMYEWLGSFDFASLYPSIMRQWNISPESYLGNFSEDEEVPSEKYIRTVTGACFDATQDSVFRTILTNYYNERKESKNKMFEIENEIEELKKYL